MKNISINKSMNKDYEWVKKQLRAFFKITPHVILGSGTSCAVDVDFGMDALKRVLLSEFASISLDKKSKKAWENVQEDLDKGTDFEHSLDSANTAQLRDKILQITGDFVAKLDQKYAPLICRQKLVWPAMAIIEKIISGLSLPDNHALNVITTNYDLLFEYACAAHNILCLNGFYGEVIKKEDWQASLRTAYHYVEIVSRNKSKAKKENLKHIRLYKVHGSLNRFFINDEVVEVDMWIGNAPEGIERVIVTPGSSKYEKIQNYRKELQFAADKSVEAANSFLFLGYGMNDTHVERYIVKKIKKECKPSLFITRDLNKRIEDLAKKCDNVWIVCGLEKPNEGTRIYNKQLDDWLYLKGEQVWDFAKFAQKIM